MSILGFCGAALCSLFLLITLSELTPKLSRLFAVCIGAALLCAALIKLVPSLTYIIEGAKSSPFSEWSGTILKALGVAVSVELTADALRDAGESGLASKLELVGKAELLILALPLIERIFKLAGGFIS